MGLGYFAWLGAAFAFLGDVVLNRGRVTARLLSTGSSVAGGAVQVLPC